MPPDVLRCICCTQRRLGKSFNLLFRGVVTDIGRIIFLILLPPVGIFLQVGIGGQFWINIILKLFGYIPGIIQAAWIIAKRQVVGIFSHVEPIAGTVVMAEAEFSRDIVLVWGFYSDLYNPQPIVIAECDRRKCGQGP